MGPKAKLFLTFFKIGSFTFGGGYAMIPLIQHEIVDKKKWLSDDEMIDMVAIAESTPGVIAVNTATFVGYKIGGVLGSLLATLGVILPSVVIILMISMFLMKYMGNEYVAFAFKGIRAGVTVLILDAGIRIFRKTPKTAISYFLISLAFFTSVFIDFQYLTLSLIAFGLIAGLISQMILRKEKKIE